MLFGGPCERALGIYVHYVTKCGKWIISDTSPCLSSQSIDSPLGTIERRSDGKTANKFKERRAP